MVLRLGLTIGREIAARRRGTVEQNRGGGLLGRQNQMDGLVDGQFAGIFVRITRDAGDLGIVQIARIGRNDFLEGSLDLERLQAVNLVRGVRESIEGIEPDIGSWAD